MTTLSLQGVGVARGIAIGKVHLVERHQQDIVERKLEEGMLEQEIARFRIAISLARQQLRSARAHVAQDASDEVTAFIETHLLMLNDLSITKEPINLIREHNCNAEWALKLQRDLLVAVFEEMDDQYLRTRKDDVDQVIQRIQRVLLDQGLKPHEQPDSHLQGFIVLAEDLAPADTVLMQHQGISAFLTERGGPTSHTAILARSIGIPSIVGLRRAMRYVHHEDMLIVDANAGIVLINPTEAVLDNYRQKLDEQVLYQQELIKLKEAPAITLDGVKIKLQANIELEKDYDSVQAVGAEGVGLYRTEYLYMNRDNPPDEEEHYQTYIKVMNALAGRSLTLRTLDLGADKTVNGMLEEETTALSSNSALGLRAIRLCLKEPTLLEPQLRAILRASARGPIRMMIPMLSNIQEVRQVLSIVASIKEEFDQKGIPYNDNIPIGGMIEVPAAAITADKFAERLDFLSIGTNDLIQYCMAIDRVNEEVNYLYDPLHPGVLKLIRMTIEAGENYNIPVAMCGEMAGESQYVRLLLSLGLREFSVHPASLLEIKRIINKSDFKALSEHTQRILDASDSEEVNQLLDMLNR